MRAEDALELRDLRAEVERLRAERARFMAEGDRHDGSCLEVKRAALAEVERLRAALRRISEACPDETDGLGQLARRALTTQEEKPDA